MPARGVLFLTLAGALTLAGCVDPNEPVRGDLLLGTDNMRMDLVVLNADAEWASIRFIVLDGDTDRFSMNETVPVAPGQENGRAAFAPRNHSIFIQITNEANDDGVWRNVPANACGGVLVWHLRLADGQLHQAEAKCDLRA